jgi:hypothetical protein
VIYFLVLVTTVSIRNVAYKYTISFGLLLSQICDLAELANAYKPSV